VTTPSSRRSRKTIRAHAAKLHPEERTVHDGIPVTSVERTILDLAAPGTASTTRRKQSSPTYWP